MTADGGEFKSETQGEGKFSHTFADAGSYAYKCLIHPDSMKGTVQVQ